MIAVVRVSKLYHHHLKNREFFCINPTENVKRGRAVIFLLSDHDFVWAFFFATPCTVFR